MGKKKKKQSIISLSSIRKDILDDLVESWDFDLKRFMLGVLENYTSKRRRFDTLRSSSPINKDRKRIKELDNEDILTDWKKRYELTGKKNTKKSWGKLIRKEISFDEARYLVTTLDEKINNIYVPPAFADLICNTVDAYLRGNFVRGGENLPKSPFLLITGPDGSGKTAMVEKVIKSHILKKQDIIKVGIEKELEENAQNHPLIGNLGLWYTNPDLYDKKKGIEKEGYLRSLSKIPLSRRSKLLRKKFMEISEESEEEDKDSLEIQYKEVGTTDIQSMWQGKPGKNFKAALPPPDMPGILKVEDAHGVFGEFKQSDGAADLQNTNLMGAVTKAMDEIQNGQRNSMIIALSAYPDRFQEAVHNRFDEQGIIYDLGEMWNNRANKHHLKEVIRREIECKDMGVEEEELDTIVSKTYKIFSERGLEITPARCRNLIGSVYDMKDGLKAEFLDDKKTIREAFKNVAKSLYGELYKKTVGKIRGNDDEEFTLEHYQGEKIKSEFCELAGNLLRRGLVNDKGVVLYGPPGSGKTCLPKAFLADNPDIMDVSIKLSQIQDNQNPNKTVENIRKVIEIATLCSPSILFIDEMDAMFGKRGMGSPLMDLYVNEILPIIDGEKSLNGVFIAGMTNFFGKLDPALLRPGRLRPIPIYGHLSKEEAKTLLEKALRHYSPDEGVDLEYIYQKAKTICLVPGDYDSFSKLISDKQDAQIKFIGQINELSHSPRKLKKLLRMNKRTLEGLLNSIDLEVPRGMKAANFILKENKDLFFERINEFGSKDSYPITEWHVKAAWDDMKKRPGKEEIYEMIEEQRAALPEENQVGFVAGAWATETNGGVLPISVTLVNKEASSIIITGAAKNQATDQDGSLEMTKQSAQGAHSALINYLSLISPDDDISKIFRDKFDHQSLQYDLKSVYYSVSGPSAGTALLIGEHSARFELLVYNDFAITGTVWTKGVTEESMGASGTIGGADLKTRGALDIPHMKRMYLPMRDFDSLKDKHIELLESYWDHDKDIIPIDSYSHLIVPEVFYYGEDHDKLLQELIGLRIERNLKELHGEDVEKLSIINEKIKLIRAGLLDVALNEQKRRLDCIKDYLIRKKEEEIYMSNKKIFREYAQKS